MRAEGRRSDATARCLGLSRERKATLKGDFAFYFFSMVSTACSPSSRNFSSAVAPPNVRIDREEIHARIQHEQSSDVIAAVSAMAAGAAEQNTMITAGSNTEVLTNRIADQLPEVAVPAHPAPAPPPPSADRLNKYRLPRKPR